MLVIMQFAFQILDPVEQQATVRIYRGDYRPIVGDLVDRSVIDFFGNTLAKKLAADIWEVESVRVTVVEGALAYSVILKPL